MVYSKFTKAYLTLEQDRRALDVIKLRVKGETLRKIAEKFSTNTDRVSTLEKRGLKLFEGCTREEVFDYIRCRHRAK